MNYSLVEFYWVSDIIADPGERVVNKIPLLVYAYILERKDKSKQNTHLKRKIPILQNSSTHYAVPNENTGLSLDPCSPPPSP